MSDTTSRLHDEQRYPFLHKNTAHVLVVSEYGALVAWALVNGTWTKQASIPVEIEIDDDGRIRWVATIAQGRA